MRQSYEIEIRCPKIFHDFKKDQPTEEGYYLCYFANTRRYVTAAYRPNEGKFVYEDGENFEKITTSDSGIFWADIYDISNFVENYLI